MCLRVEDSKRLLCDRQKPTFSLSCVDLSWLLIVFMILSPCATIWLPPKQIYPQLSKAYKDIY